jgi:hypothetical protein
MPEVGGGSELLAVPVSTIDCAVSKFGVPSFIKVDVEGYELNVLKGAKATLASNQLVHLFVEVHFALLEARGLPLAGDDIQTMLTSFDFATRFVDFSHLQADKS